MIEITSKDNSVLKEYRKLCDSRRYRRQSGKFVLEGVRLICDYLKSGGEADDLLVTAGGLQKLEGRLPDIPSAARRLLLITEPLAGYIARTETPQGVFAICRGTLVREGLPDDTANGALLLCSLQDPGNVGAILRSAEAFGLSAVIMTSDCPDAASPKVLRASMGAAMRLPIYLVDDAESAVGGLRQSGKSVYAAAPGQRSAPVDEVPLAGAVVAIGNEGSGLPEALADSCDRRVALPMNEKSESLNAAMAATVFAWELSRAAKIDRKGGKV